jgi:hypothetical protein
MMISTELLISDLYQTCAEIWEQDGAFWSALVEEEKKHAMNMKKMAKIIADKPERFDMGRPFNQIAQVNDDETHSGAEDKRIFYRQGEPHFLESPILGTCGSD